MERIPTTHATNIHAVGYDIPNHLLEVEFNDGSVQQYQKVEQEVYERLIHATPVDDYFDQHIKGKYQQPSLYQKPTPAHQQRCSNPTAAPEPDC